MQLHFDRPFISAYTWPRIRIGDKVIHLGDAGYRDRLCDQIAKLVADVAEQKDDKLAVVFADGVSLEPEVQWEIIESMPALLTSSTARDIAAGRPSELDAITGAAVRASHRVGVPAPVLEQLLAEAEDACRALSR